MSFKCTFKANLASQKHDNVPKVYPSISMGVDIFANILLYLTRNPGATTMDFLTFITNTANEYFNQ
jgi:hypothetical protein